MPRSHRFLLLACALLPALATAAVERLDDSASPRAQVQAQLRTDAANPTLASVSFGRIEYRLSTVRHVGREARIYYVIPLAVPGVTSPAALQVNWRAAGPFASGSGRPGDRVLVWTGVVGEPMMGDSFEVEMQLDLARLRVLHGMNIGFESYFEIETMP